MTSYVTNDFFIDAARGAILKYSPERKFGHNPNIANGVLADVWQATGTYVFPSDSGITLEIVSDAADTVVVKVEGLDANFDLQSTTVTLTGVTAVTLPGVWTRVNRAYVDDSTACVGTIHIRDEATSTVVYAQIEPAQQQTAQVIYTVPNRKTAFIFFGTAAMTRTGATAAVDVSLHVREFGKIFREIDRRGLLGDGASTLDANWIIPVKAPAKSDIKASAISTANNTSVTASIQMLLLEDKPGSSITNEV